jgi:hypothetical protein
MEALSSIMEKLARPQKSPVGSNSRQADQAALELETAKEILAEVFRIRTSEVDEMILGRLEEALIPDRSNGDGLWPREFRLDG